MDPKPFLASLFTAAVDAADPRRIIAVHLPSRLKGRTIVIGAGKGVAHLARAFDEAWDAPLEGTVVTRYGYGVDCPRIAVREASHPVPDQAGLLAALELRRLVANLTEDDLVVSLMCGGGSALLPAPLAGLTLDDEIALNRALLHCGAPISAMNVLRKSISGIKGGRLAIAAFPARVVTLVVSDVPGDDPALVCSGPTIASESTRADALAVVSDYRLALPEAILAHLSSGEPDSPLPCDPRLSRCETKVIASAAQSLEAAADLARGQGLDAVILSDAIEGEARDVGQVHAAIALEIARKDRPFRKPVLVLSGGETTVTMRRDRKGRGGRNSAFLLSFALGIQGCGSIHALAADTDGIDGSEGNAGAFADGTTVSRMRQAGVVAREMLHGNDAWTAFDSVGDLFTPGPTGTNVNDFRAILIR
ncbi:hydroxypyruvate reductase [Aureimonas sp. Leaf454]|nr:hydroxypyruvate reductase [Aureimonas sp. Leaf454]